MVKIREIMTKQVCSIQESQTVKEAYDLMRQLQVRHLPVLNATHRLVGIVSQGDILLETRMVEDEIVLTTKPIKDIMSKDVITCTPSCRATNVAATMIACKIGSVPVVSHGALVGIVTTTDLLDLICRDDEIQGHQVMPLSFLGRDQIL